MIGAGLIAQAGPGARPQCPAVREDLARPGLEGRHGVPRSRRAAAARSRSSASTSSGTAAPRASATSGPLPPHVGESPSTASDAYVAAVLSGNRNFEARIHNQVRANYLASPMLVVAYALAGRVDVDLSKEPLGTGSRRSPGLPAGPLADAPRRSASSSNRHLDPAIFREKYRTDHRGRPALGARCRRPATGGELPVESGLHVPAAAAVLRDPGRRPPRPDGTLVLEGLGSSPLLGDRVSTDHISPAGEIPADSPAGRYLIEHGVAPADFNTYGTRRGNHEVLVRGTLRERPARRTDSPEARRVGSRRTSPPGRR